MITIEQREVDADFTRPMQHAEMSGIAYTPKAGMSSS